jgi:hypothetical protein
VTAPESRYGHQLAYDSARGHTLLFGGAGVGGYPTDLLSYDGSTWQVRPTAVSPPGRIYHAMTFDLRRERCIVFGGSASDGSRLGDTWEWDGATWIPCATTGPSPRFDVAMAFHFATGQTILHGGADASGPRNDTWAWDGVQWTRLLPATAMLPHAGHCMTADLHRNRLVMFGGQDPLAWEWTGTDWVAAPAGPSPRTLAAMATDLSGQTILLGGQAVPVASYQASGLGDIWFWDGTRWRQHRRSGPPPRGSIAAAFDEARGRLVTVGGTEGFASVAHVWEFDGVGWNELARANEPPVASLSQLCYDRGRGVNVLFGGVAGFNLPAGTWEWNGKAWTLAQPAIAPSGRYAHAMTYDDARGNVVLFGGRDFSGFLQDTWEWNGTAWSLRANGGPAARSGHALAHDELRHRTVLFGGDRPSPGYAVSSLGDTWEWDGGTWQQIAPAASPAPRAHHSLVFDRRRGVTVLVGGSRGGLDLHEVWEWDGSSWRGGARDVPSRPGQRMVFDDQRGALVIVTPVFAGTIAVSNDLWIGSPQVATTAVEGTGCGGALTPALRSFGAPTIERGALALEVADAPPNQLVLVGVAPALLPLPLGHGCTFYLHAGTAAVASYSNEQGFASFVVAVPRRPALIGLAALFQAGVLDPGAPLGIALSAALLTRIGD